MKYLYCHDFKEFDFNCCSSCHTDDEEGYVSMSEMPFSDDVDIVCCCGLSNYYKNLENTELFDQEVLRLIKDKYGDD